MSNEYENAGADLHNSDEEARRQAARMLGSIRTERKAESSRQNAAKRRGIPLSEEHKAKLREAQRIRWKREKAEAPKIGRAHV